MTFKVVQPNTGVMLMDMSLGAVINGRIFMDRLENWYAFVDDNGHRLCNCYEWDELKKCFEYLVDHINELQDSPA